MGNRRNDKQILGQTASSGNLVDRGEQQFGASADEQLLVSIVEGDENAFAELYRRYSQGLYNYLLRLMYDSSGAEDVLQDVFLVVWQNAGSYRGGASVKTWVYRIGHHRAISWLRQHRRTIAFDDNNDPTIGAGPEPEPDGTWQDDDIQNALRRLSPKHRAVLELAFVQDLSYLEIAHILNIPLGTIKSRMSYALRAIGGILKGNQTPDQAEGQAEE